MNKLLRVFYIAFLIACLLQSVQSAPLKEIDLPPANHIYQGLGLFADFGSVQLNNANLTFENIAFSESGGQEKFKADVKLNVTMSSGNTSSQVQFSGNVDDSLVERVKDNKDETIEIDLVPLSLKSLEPVSLGSGANLLELKIVSPSKFETRIEDNEDGTFDFSSYLDLFQVLEIDNGLMVLPQTNGVPGHLELNGTGRYAIPEPSTYALMLTGLLIIIGFNRKR